MSVPKIILIWLIVTKKWCAHQYTLFRPLFTLSTLFGLKNQNFWKIKELTGEYDVDSHYMMWIALQVILGHLCLLPNFWPQKIKIFEKKKKTPGYIIILHLHPKNHNHLMYSSLKIMPTALQVSLGQFLLVYSIFGPTLKFSKNGEIPKIY